MKSGRIWKIAAIALTLILAPIAILYGFMRPRDPGFAFRFLKGCKPIQVGLTQEMGGGSNGYEFAVYHWKAPFAEVVREAEAELSDFKVYNPDSKFVGLKQKHGINVKIMATRLTTGKLTFRDKYDIIDPNYVTVMIERHLPEGLFSELRVIQFATRF